MIDGPGAKTVQEPLRTARRLLNIAPEGCAHEDVRDGPVSDSRYSPRVPELTRSFASLTANPQVSAANDRESMIAITGGEIVIDGGRLAARQRRGHRKDSVMKRRVM
jgi:hypothetical protein